MFFHLRVWILIHKLRDEVARTLEYQNANLLLIKALMIIYSSKLKFATAIYKISRALCNSISIEIAAASPAPHLPIFWFNIKIGSLTSLQWNHYLEPYSWTALKRGNSRVVLILCRGQNTIHALWSCSIKWQGKTMVYQWSSTNQIWDTYTTCMLIHQTCTLRFIN